MKNATHIIRTVIAVPLTAMGVLSLAPQVVRADDAAAGAAGGPAKEESAAATHGEPGLQEVVVTATRHEESLSKVPISVTALTQDAMDSRGIKDFQDIARFTPGVSIDNSGTNAISIRGISSSAGAGTTGIYLDDTPIQMRNVGFNPEDTLPKTFDLERVEILRGPQGTLFGAGAEGGAVRYIFAQPSLTASSSNIRSEVSYTEYGQPSYEFGVAHGQPLIDGTLGWRASIWYRNDGGWIDRVSPSSEDDVIEHNVNYSHTLVTRLAAIWQPRDGLTLTPNFLFQDRQTHDQPTYWPAYSNPGSGQFNTATPEAIRDPDQFYLGAIKLQWDLGKSAIISNTSYYHRWNQTGYQGTVYDLAFYQSLGWNNNPLFGAASGVPGAIGLGCQAAPAVNASACPWYPLINANGLLNGIPGRAPLPAQFADYSTPNVMTNTQNTWVQELRWQSSDENSRLKYTVGVFWELAKEGSTENLLDPNIDPFFVYLYGVPATQLFTYQPTPGGPFIAPYSCPGDPYYPTGYSAVPQCSIYWNANTTYDRQLAGYTEMSYQLTDQWRLTVGQRVARTEFNLDHYANGLENFGPSPLPPAPLGSQVKASESETSNTPRVSLAWQIDNLNMVYATYSKGFRPGGGNAPLPTYCGPGPGTPLTLAGYPNGAPLTYGSDTTQNYEIGSKNAFGPSLKIATSVYYIKWSGIQQNVYVAGTCGLQFTDNLGDAVAKGFDMQAELALGSSFFMDLSVGYTNAKFTENSLPPGGAGYPLRAADGDAISGEAAIDYAPGTNPPWQVAVGPEYRFTIKNHEAFVRFDWEYESRNPWLAPVQDPNTSQFFPYTYTLSSTTFASLRGGVTLGDWQVTPFIDNLFNNHTTTNYALGQLDPYNPDHLPGMPGVGPGTLVGAPTPQENAYTFRPRTFGITASWRIGH
jgi:iron complex outermembrane recepter protein